MKPRLLIILFSSILLEGCIVIELGVPIVYDIYRCVYTDINKRDKGCPDEDAVNPDGIPINIKE